MTRDRVVLRRHECHRTLERADTRRQPTRALARLLGSQEAGFTLVETLVAFAVLALILTVLLGGLSRMTTGGRRAEILRQALALAQAKLDGLGIAEPLAPGESTGRFENGFDWRLRVGDLSNTAGATRLTGAWAEITVSASAGGMPAPAAVSLVNFKLAGARRQ